MSAKQRKNAKNLNVTKLMLEEFFLWFSGITSCL